MIDNFEAGRGAQELPEVSRGGTWWRAYNAVTEHLTYDRGRAEDSRLNSLWFGELVRINGRALQTALELSA
jgi:hypothetical protein